MKFIFLSMEVSTFYSTLEIIEFGLLGLFFGWWIKYLFGQGDVLSDFLTKKGYFPIRVAFFHSVLMGLIIYLDDEWHYDIIVLFTKALFLNWIGFIIGGLMWLFIYAVYIYLLNSFCHKDGSKAPGTLHTVKTSDIWFVGASGTCPHCLKKVSRLAGRCPHCTADFTK